MKKLLILASNCYENASANGICAKALNTALCEMGGQTYIIGYGDQTSVMDRGGKQERFTVKQAELKKAPSSGLAAKFSLLISCIRRAISPALDDRIVRDYYNLALEIYKTYEYDAIVAILFPLEFTKAARKLKKGLLGVNYLIYELDSVTDGIQGGSRLNGLFQMAYKRYMRRQYAAADHVFIMQSHMEHVKKVYPRFLDKFIVTDLPVLTEHVFPKTGRRGDEINFFYTGILDGGYRSPEKVLSVFESAADKPDWRLHFYSKGNCEEMIGAAARRDRRIAQHGYVPPEQLELAAADADFFISIGNASSNSVPSKLISYLSYGRPIIHFSLQENDPCLNYLEKYPLALIIRHDEQKEQCRKRLTDFAAQARGKSLSFAQVKGIYYMNTPEYSAKLILDRTEVPSHE